MTNPSTPAPANTPSRRMKGKQQQQNQKNPAIAEVSRIKIRQILEQFRVSDEQVYTFDANLTNIERAEVHELCKKMGMKSKSSGSKSGNQRRVSVYKFKRAYNLIEEKKNLTPFTFSEDGKIVLRDLFTCHPPDDNEVGEKIVGKVVVHADNNRRKKDDILGRPSMNKAEIAKKLESVASKRDKSPNLKQITEARSKLPIASFKDIITSTVESHQVVLISGETGCGKTTQVPQYLLDYMWNKGETCKIVCTQPRRISATSVAERISSERGENIGDSVGYKIKLESKGGRHSSIVFCTNGVLLRVLVTNGSGRSRREASRKKAENNFSDITHIVVITHPDKSLPELLEDSMNAIAHVLSYDGLAGIALQSEPVDSLTSMVKATDIGQSENGRKGLGQNRSSFLQSLVGPKGHGSHHPKGVAAHKPFYHQAKIALPLNTSKSFNSEGSTRSGHGSLTSPRGDSLKRNRGNRY